MSSKRIPQRLDDIIENAAAIETYLAGMTFEAFITDRKTVDAVERCLERILEACVKIGTAPMGRIAPDQSMKVIRGLGNMLRHEYDVIDLRTIYDTAGSDLPALVDGCRAELRRLLPNNH